MPSLAAAYTVAETHEATPICINWACGGKSVDAVPLSSLTSVPWSSELPTTRDRHTYLLSVDHGQRPRHTIRFRPTAAADRKAYGLWIKPLARRTLRVRLVGRTLLGDRDLHLCPPRSLRHVKPSTFAIDLRDRVAVYRRPTRVKFTPAPPGTTDGPRANCVSPRPTVTERPAMMPSVAPKTTSDK
jgi:hypothetical protein